MRVLCPGCKKFRALTKFSRLRIHQSPQGGLCLGSGQRVDMSSDSTPKEPERLPRKVRSQRGGVLD